MAELIVKTEDIQAAVDFLTEYLTEQVPEASFAEGSAVRDLVIKAFAPMYAYLKAEADRISLLQSISRIQEELANGGTSALEDVDTSQAIDSILSNWFVSRNSGQRATGIAQLHFTRKSTVNIRRDARLWRTTTLAFYPDTTSDSIVITENQLRPTYDTRGRLVDYVAVIPIVAAKVGDLYQFDAGRFIRIEVQGGLPFFAYAEHQQPIGGGTSVEATEDYIERAETAIAVRNLVNNRSIDAVLPDVVPEVSKQLTVGMGEPEMVRDLRTEMYPAIELHIGGHHDTYVDLPEVQVEESGIIGALFSRPDGLVTAFRDPGLTHDVAGADFVSLGVQAGYILNIISGIVGAPRGFPIVRVTADTLYVSEHVPFDEASDELDTNSVLYSIGWLSPGFSEVDFDPAVLTSEYARIAIASVDPLWSNITPGTSRRVGESGAIILSGQPVQDVITVEITDPDPAWTLVDPATGTVRFTNRVNGTPAMGSMLGTGQYQVECLNPAHGQSMQAVNVIRVGPATDLTMYDGKNLRVSYRSLRSIQALHDYVTSYNQRVLNSNHLIKARNPIWIDVQIPYRLKPTATTSLTTGEAKQIIANHINAFDPNDDLDMSDLATVLRSSYEDVVGTVYPFTIEYDLHAPDGQILQFETTDIVSIFPKTTNGVTLVNRADIIVPDVLAAKGITEIVSDTDLLTLYAYYGISDRTITYKSRSDLISFTLRG